MNYNELTLQHFESATHAGVLRGPATRRGAAGSRVLGTWVQFDVQIDAHTQTLQAVRFLAYGCPHVIAVADWVAQQSVGLRPDLGLKGAVALPESVTSLQQRFAVPIEKRGRLLVIEDAWIAAVSPPPRE